MTRRSRDRYGERAAKSYRGLIDPALATLRPRVVRVCQSLGIHDVLDIACATGAQCRALGKAGFQVTGLDLSEAMIDAAKKAGGRNVRYVQGSAYELPFVSASFDAAILSLALHEHTESERRLMIDEAVRILRPEGHLILADYAKPQPTPIHLPWQIICAVEYIAGPEHNAGFRDYVRRGSLRGLIDRLGMEAVVLGRSHFRAIEIAVCRIPNRR